MDLLGPVQISYVENAILIAATSTFLAVKPKKDHVDIEFILDREIQDFPVHKTVRISRFKAANFIKLGSPEDVDGMIGRWIGEAYLVNKGGKKTDDR